MGDLPPSVSEEWVRELVGNIGVYSYMKVSSYFCVLISIGLFTLASIFHVHPNLGKSRKTY